MANSHKSFVHFLGSGGVQGLGTQTLCNAPAGIFKGKALEWDF